MSSCAPTVTHCRAPTSSDSDGELDHDDHDVEETKLCSDMKLAVDIERLMNCS